MRHVNVKCTTRETLLLDRVLLENMNGMFSTPKANKKVEFGPACNQLYAPATSNRDKMIFSNNIV